ncbi:Asp23/Gls24 family envelope stress response protein [Gordonia shandongensis]|uniref:Asp23/Gls24 family envelope stress response protein n=1 Tax=Gordonia shandongensis TaxID=376351 RepID=UPI00040FC915|nr:Asp23/Gls24 family envelope stress response protein [Gordonia shandongensis]
MAPGEGRRDELPGRLTVVDAVFEKIALGAALEVDGVVRHGDSVAGRIGSLVSRDTTAGTSFPRARVESVGGAAHVVDITLAVVWPSPIARICRDVRTRVSDELDRLTGGRPVRVDVTVGEVVAGDAARLRKRGIVELPDTDGDHGADGDDRDDRDDGGDERRTPESSDDRQEDDREEEVTS